METARSGMNASLLVQHPETRKIYVNFDPKILELVQEAKYLKKLALDIPESAIFLCKKSEQIKEYNVT